MQMFADYERANATIEGLSKKVNKKVMQMFEKAEQEYGELKRKKDVVEGDKARIEQVRQLRVGEAFGVGYWDWYCRACGGRRMRQGSSAPVLNGLGCMRSAGIPPHRIIHI